MKSGGRRSGNRRATEAISDRSSKAIVSWEATREDAIDAGRIELPDRSVESRSDSGEVALGAEISDRRAATMTLDVRQRIANEASDSIAPVIRRQRSAR